VTQIVFVGSGDAFGSGGRRQTCIGLTGDDQFMLVGCGTTSVLGRKTMGLDPNLVSAVVISHLYGDHFGGLPFLILDGQFSGRTQPLLVAGPPGTRDRLTQAMELLFPGSSQIRRRFEVKVRELALDSSPQPLGAATVRGWEVDHASGAPIPSVSQSATTSTTRRCACTSMSWKRASSYSRTCRRTCSTTSMTSTCQPPATG
jgi:ribonuclease BN (tRNA processing enzyme)